MKNWRSALGFFEECDASVRRLPRSIRMKRPRRWVSMSTWERRDTTGRVFDFPGGLPPNVTGLSRQWGNGMIANGYYRSFPHFHPFPSKPNK